VKAVFRPPKLLSRHPHRPLALGIVFWLVFALVLVRYFAYEQPQPHQEWLFGLNMVALLVLWMILPWDASASRLRRFAAPCFLLTANMLGLTGSAAVHFPLILVGVAAVAMVNGMAIAVATAVALGGIVLVALLVLSPRDVLSIVSEVSFFALNAAFALGMASATLEARRRREESDHLLGRIRELTVAEERARMARDMHDSIGHYLTVIKMGLENAERFRERRPDAAWDEVGQSKQLTVQALAETRRWVRALRPLDLDDTIGSVALDRLTRSFDGSGMAIDFAVEGAESPLDADTELTLYRALQEGLTNVLRHSEATSVRVRLAFDDAWVTLAIRDDGRGTESEPGFGLISLTERTEALGGRLHLRNADGGGVELRVELPAAAR
jgi:signal transduction histidine kinase